MKRFRYAVLVLAIMISLGLHALIFLRLPGLEEEKISPDETTYQVSLRYFTRQKEVKVEQPGRRVKIEEEKLKPVEKPPQQEEEKPVLQEEAVMEEQVREEEAVQEEPVVEEEALAEYQSELPVGESEDSEESSALEIREDEIRYDQVVAELRSRIVENKTYPQVARKRNIEGVVQILLSLDEHGEAVELRIIESSGNRILDKAALQLIQKVLPYEHGLGRGFSVQIPIRYDLS
jgi:protein TonB